MAKHPHPLAHVPRVLNPENQCSECAQVFLPAELDEEGLCAKCAAGEYDPGPITAEWCARAFFSVLSLGEHNAAAGYLAQVVLFLPEHAEALAPLIALVRAGDPDVMGHPSIHIATELSARYGMPGT